MAVGVFKKNFFIEAVQLTSFFALDSLQMEPRQRGACMQYFSQMLLQALGLTGLATYIDGQCEFVM